MPAVSKAQQQAAAIALHHPGKAKTGMGSMSKTELRKFAETPRKGLPKHKSNESLVNQIVDELLDEG